MELRGLALDPNKNTILGRVLIEKIVLSLNKKVSQDDIKYLQIHLHKDPRTKTINETSSERIKPTFTDDDEAEVSFFVSEEDRDNFLLHFRSDVLPEVNQYQIELQIKKISKNFKFQKFQTKTVGSFGICYNDMELDSLSEKLKTRQLRSEVNLVDGIEIKYKVCDSSSQRAVSPPVRVSTPPHSVPAPDTPDTPCLLSESVSPEFRLRSCVVVLGSTGRGKTTTMNLYTSNTAETGGATHSTTQETRLYPDLHHPDNPLWLDTVGLDDPDSMKNNSELMRSYLLKLKDAKVKWVHAVVWCITPEEKKLPYLKDQAEMIKLFGNNSKQIWRNVIIIAKQGNRSNHEASFQGALAAISEVEGGHQGLVSPDHCLQYDLNTQTSASARTLLHQALASIKTPVQVVFSNKVCLDCGQRGDERLLSDLCHDLKEEKPWAYFSAYLPKRFQCSHCKRNWSRKICGRWSFTSGPPCVRIRNRKDIKPGETFAGSKTQHNMIEYKWWWQ